MTSFARTFGYAPPPAHRNCACFSGAVFDVVFQGSEFYIMLGEQDGEHMLLDTRFPDFTVWEESVELVSFGDGEKVRLEPRSFATVPTRN